MKKNFFIILTILLIIAIIVGYTVHNYRKQQIQIAQYNKQYESWYGKKILGTDFISIINKTIDNNEKNDVQKDENNVYLEDNEKSVKIYIKFLESDQTFDMEAIANNGIENFIQNYATFSFKCTKIDYHKNGNVKNLFFEEV
ncbi:MAG: hypothetical protein HP028_00690 [Clostridia bacterium]|jgi:uncharacterized protein YpmS|nr:hypothetical protein [Clostridia bacterium]